MLCAFVVVSSKSAKIHTVIWLVDMLEWLLAFKCMCICDWGPQSVCGCLVERMIINGVSVCV